MDTLKRLWREHNRAIIAVVVALAAAVGVTVTVTDDNGDGRPEVVTVKIDNADGDRAQDDTLTVPERAIEAVEKTDAGDHAGEREETAEVKAPDGPPVPEETTLASPEQPGCETRLVRNFSSRNGQSPRLWVLHYTVSANRPGRSDVDGITAFFNNSASQASSHYVIDNEGNCNLIVPEIQKSWTEGSFNPVSISVEVINTGSESSYAGTAGLDKLAHVIADSAARWKIPVQRGATSGCTVTRAGIVDHDSLACGNNHTDIRPFSVDEVVAAVLRVRGGARVLTAKERKIVAGVRKPKGTGHSKRFWCRRLAGQLFWLNQATKQPRRAGRLRIQKRVWRVRCSGA